MTTDADRVKAAENTQRKPLTALEWLRVTHADTLSGRRIEEALAEARAPYDRLTADLRALVEELSTLGELNMARADEHREAEREADESYRIGRSISYTQSAEKLRAAARLRAVVAGAEDAKA